MKNDSKWNTENPPAKGHSGGHFDWMTTLLALALLITAVYLSDTSMYYVRGVSSPNLEIALMLTPWGILNNLWLEANHYLRPYYLEPALRHGIFQDPKVRADVAILWGFAIGALFSGYRLKHPISQNHDTPRRPRRRWRRRDISRDHSISDRSQDNAPH